MMVSSGSKILLSDSVSRDNSDGSCDTYPDGYIWQHVRIHGTSLRGETISREDAYKDRHVLDMIGRWYAECEYDDRRQPPPKNAAGGPIPWGAILPVRLEHDNIDALCKQSIRTWSGVLKPGMAHTFSTFLFYSVREARPEDIEDYERDRASNTELEDLGALYYVAVLYFPVEREAFHDDKDSLEEILSSEKILHNYLNRRYSLFSKSVPHTALHVMKPGEAISQVLRYDPAALEQFDRDDHLVSRFMDAYVRAVLELSDRPGSRDVVAREYWLARLKISPEVFTAVDARNRMVLYASYLRAVSLGDKEGAQRIENGLVRLMRYIYELGWPNEHNMISYIYWCGLDKGRAPQELSAGASSSLLLRKNELSPVSKKRLSHLLTGTRTSFGALEKAYVEGAHRNALPSLGPSIIPMTPPDLECLSKRNTRAGLDRDWIRRKDCTYVGLADAERLSAGDSFLVAEGYPTRFYHESDPDRDDAYTKIAMDLFLLQKPGATYEELSVATLPIAGGRSILVYPALIFDSLASLRAELRTELVQPCHRPSGLFSLIGPIDRDLSVRDWRLTSPQPSLQSAIEGIKQTLWPSSMVGEEGTPLAVVPTDLMMAIQRSKILYQSGHPSEASSPLVAPTVFWLRPLHDIVGSNPAPEAMKILEKLPTVDIETMGKRALVLAYREWPFALSEAVRCQLHRYRDKMASHYQGNLATTLRREFGSENPASLIALTDRVNGVILKNANCGGICLELDLISNIQLEELEDHYNDVQESSTTTASAAGDHLPLPPHRAPSARAPNGLHSTDDLVLVRNRKFALEADSRQYVARQIDERAEMFNACDLEPERVRDAVWQRPGTDPKKSIGVTAMEKNGKFPQTFSWRDWKAGLGFVGSRALSAYAYVMQEGADDDAVRRAFSERKENRWGSGRFVYELLSTLPGPRRSKFWEFLERTMKPLYESITAKPRDDLPAPEQQRAPKKARPDKGNESGAQRLWRTALQVTGPGLVYLRQTRGLYNISPNIIEHSPFLRYATHLVYNLEGEALSDSKIHNGLLLFMTEANGHAEPAAVQRIFLTNEGKKFVPRSGSGKMKLTLGSSAGRAWCAQPGRLEHLPCIFLCEGPEKALAVASCSRYAPCFASMGVSNLRNFSHFRELVPQPALVIVGDADGTIKDQQNEIRALQRGGWKNVLHWLPWCAGGPCKCKDASDVMVNHSVITLAIQLAPHLPLWSFGTETLPQHAEEPQVEWQRYPCLVTK